MSRLWAPEVAIQTIDGGHGRIETRSLRVSDKIDWLENEHSWAGLKSILAVTSKREIGEKVTEETRYFISSLSAGDPGKLERAVRAHGSIENNLHWVLDVAFDEDSNRTRKGYSAANLAVTRYIALNLIKAEETAKVGVKTKRLMAGWDNDYLLKIIGVI